LRGTSTYALCFGGSDIFLHGYVDSYIAGDKDSRRSTMFFFFTVGGTKITWISKMQKVAALLTKEIEYVVGTKDSK
jgi:hypothetical protein